MNYDLKPDTMQDSGRSPLWGIAAWDTLIEKIKAFQPDVVVLVARKMPRLVEYLGADFGKDVSVVTDLAIPFASSQLRYARVAIVDDVVNVGSTLANALANVQICGPNSVEVFSLGFRTRKSDSPFPQSVIYAIEKPLSDLEYQQHVRGVPAAIRGMNKPYDLAFPIIPSRYVLPYRTANEIVLALRQKLGAEYVQVLPAPYHNSPAKRVTIQLTNKESPAQINEKLRLYFDDELRICNVVPISVPSPLNKEDIHLASSKAIALKRGLDALLDSAPKVRPCALKDAQASALLFCHSLDWFIGSDMQQMLGDYLEQAVQEDFSMPDATLLFSSNVAGLADTPLLTQEALDRTSATPTASSSPFLKSFDRTCLLKSTLSRLIATSPLHPTVGFDCYAFLTALMDSLSEMVGADDPHTYKLAWPYTPTEVVANPYLRLRIGPTFRDLLALITELVQARGQTAPEQETLRLAVSMVLDACIDQGSVVPTFAEYDGKMYRIYRRGENHGREEVCNRVLYALANYGKPLSLTRISKILETLSLSEEFAHLLEPDAALRGYVATLPRTSIDSESTEVAHFLRDTGKLRSTKA